MSGLSSSEEALYNSKKGSGVAKMVQGRTISELNAIVGGMQEAVGQAKNLSGINNDHLKEMISYIKLHIKRIR